MSSVWVGSFPEDTTREDLEEAFSRYGPVNSCEIKTQPMPGGGESRYAFVNFEEEGSAEDALSDTWVELPSGVVAKVAPAKRKGAGDRGKTTSNRPPLSRPRPPPTDCSFFLTDSCRSGDRCSFRHSETVRTKRPDVCKEWRAHNCFNWDCPNYHPKTLPASYEESDRRGAVSPQMHTRPKPNSQRSPHSTQPPKKPAWGKVQQEGAPWGDEAVIIISGIHNQRNSDEVVTNTVGRAVAAVKLKASTQVIYSSYREAKVVVTPDSGGGARSPVVVSGFVEQLQEACNGVSGDERWEVELQHWSLEKRENTLSRSKMIECLQSFEYHWARLDDFIANCSSRFSLEVSGDMIRSRCSGAIEVLLDDPSDHMNKLVLFSELSPLATVDEDKAVKTSLKENLVELLRSTPERALKLLNVPVLYEEKYGPLPLTTASGKTCVKDVVKAVLSLQGSKLTETIVILQSQPVSSPPTPPRASAKTNVTHTADGASSVIVSPPPSASTPVVTPVIATTTTVVTTVPTPDQPNKSEGSTSAPKHVEENKLAPQPRAAEVKVPRDLVLRLADIQKPLTRESYKEKFVKLLLWEENEQRLALRTRCEYFEAVLHVQPPTTVQSPSERLAYVHMDSDTLAYIKQVADRERAQMVLEQGTRLNKGQFMLQDDVVVRITRLVFDHTHSIDQLAVVLNEEDMEVLSDFLLSEGSLDAPVLLRLNFKDDTFHTLRQEVTTLPGSVIRRLLPEQNDFPAVRDQPLWAGLEPFTKKCSADQKLALQSILSVPPNGPPFLLLGARGTGKTFLLVTAVCCFVQEAQERGFPLRVLVCSRDHKSASGFLLRFHDCLSEAPLQEQLHTVQLVPDGEDLCWEHKKECVCAVSTFRGDREKVLREEALLVVSTYGTSRQVVDMVPSGFFTHIILDGSGQLLEPECTIPLHLVGGYTRVVICGDERQVVAELVLGEETCANGLSVSLLQRLHVRYERFGIQSGPFEAMLVTEHCSNPEIVKFVGKVFYNMDLQATSPSSTHPDLAFPLVFVCSSVEDEDMPEERLDGEEVLIKVVGKYAASWPEDLWGEKDLSQLCVMGQTWNQLALVSKLLNEGQELGLQSTSLQPYCNLQCGQFRAVFVSTSEPTEVLEDGSVAPSNPTKSICDPFVLNTVITRAQSLVVCVGNPFLLLRLEQSMVRRYGDRGKCWSHYLKACLDHDTVQLHDSQLSLELLRRMLEERIVERGGSGSPG